MQNQFSILAMIQQGYYATYPLLFISVACLAIIFERLWALRGISSRAAKLADSLVPQLRQGKVNEALQATQARANPPECVYHTIIAGSQTLDRDHLAELDEERLYQEQLELTRYIWVLATAGASAPFIGLFGTVVGICPRPSRPEAMPPGKPRPVNLILAGRKRPTGSRATGRRQRPPAW
jgi:biopolymer transport protein ExbB/TolQ